MVYELSDKDKRKAREGSNLGTEEKISATSQII
jgi:hypothetical protein